MKWNQKPYKFYITWESKKIIYSLRTSRTKNYKERGQYGREQRIIITAYKLTGEIPF